MGVVDVLTVADHDLDLDRALKAFDERVDEQRNLASRLWLGRDSECGWSVSDGHGLIVTSHREVEDRFCEGCLVPERLVDHLRGHL